MRRMPGISRISAIPRLRLSAVVASPVSSTMPFMLVMLTWTSSPKSGSSLRALRALISIDSSSTKAPRVRRSPAAVAAVAPPATMTGAQPCVRATTPKTTARNGNRLSILALPEKLVVDEIAQAMDDDAVHFLNARRGRAWHADVDVVAREHG